MNKEEFESCYNRHFDFVYRLSFTYVKNPADAEDVAQETFVRLYRQGGGICVRGACQALAAAGSDQSVKGSSAVPLESKKAGVR